MAEKVYICITVANNMLRRLKKHSHLLHKLGLFMSLLCFIHCLSMPIILTALPYFAEKYLSHAAEFLLVIVSILLALIVQVKDFRNHKNWLPLILLAIAALLFSVSFMVFEHSKNHIISSLGSLLMAASFVLNWNIHRKHCSNHAH
jgi:hypothetical protein